MCTDEVDAKCFQCMTTAMKINLGLKHSLLSQVSNSICLHSTRIYAPFQPDKNLILGNKALQIEFKGEKKKAAFPNYFQSPTTRGFNSGNTESCHHKSRADIRPLNTVALADSYTKINTNSARFCYENKAMKFPHAHLPKGRNSDQLCWRGFLKSF